MKLVNEQDDRKRNEIMQTWRKTMIEMPNDLYGDKLNGEI
jgi:hypothetical protein